MIGKMTYRLLMEMSDKIAGGAILEVVRMQGGGHTPPSQKHPLPRGFWVKRIYGPTCRDIEGARLAWEFLKQHRLDE